MCIPKCGPVADLNGDCFVSFEDHATFASQWFQSLGSPSADIAADLTDGFVDLRDLAVLTGSWLEQRLWPGCVASAK